MDQKSFFYPVFLASLFFSFNMHSTHESKAAKEEIEDESEEEPEELEKDKAAAIMLDKLIKLNIGGALEAEKFTTEENRENLKTDKVLVNSIYSSIRADLIKSLLDRGYFAKTKKEFLCFKSGKSIEFSDYVNRFRRYFNVESSVIITAVIYMDRFKDLHKVFLARDNVHRIFLVAFNLAQKMLLDAPWENASMAQIGGVSLVEMNYLEHIFLQALNCEAYISHITYEEYAQQFSKARDLIHDLAQTSPPVRKD